MTSSATKAADIARFFEAIKENRVADVSVSLESGISANACDTAGDSALTLAVLHGHHDVVRLLLAAGANVNRRHIQSSDSIGTPLHITLTAKTVNMATLLLDAGADPRVTDHRNYNAAHVLVASQFLPRPADPSPERLPELYKRTINMRQRALMVFERIISVEGVLSGRSFENQTPLQMALWRDINPVAIDMMLAHGAVPDLRPPIQEGNINCEWTEKNLWKLRKMVELGADINCRDATGGSPLALAGDVVAVEAILALGGDINHLDDLGRNALARILDQPSSNKVDVEVVTALIAAGIDTTHLDYTGSSVEARLAERATPQTDQLVALCGAQRARAAISRAFRKAAAKPE